MGRTLDRYRIPKEPLDGIWQLKTFSQPADGAIRSLPLPADLDVKTYRASVPGCCEEEVWKAGELPDYLYSTVAEDGRVLVVNDTASDVRGDVRLVEAADGRKVFEARYHAKANAVCEVGRVSWRGQGLFRIAYTVDGREMRSHYLHGEPPFAWKDYCHWTAEYL